MRTVCEQGTTSRRRGDFRILEAYTRALRSARASWSPREPVSLVAELVEILAEKLRRPPTPGSARRRRPARANNGADDTRGQLSVLVEADDGGGAACWPARSTPATRRRGTNPVYVHAKIGIVDDRWLTIGSANINAHSLFNDSEVNVVTQDRALARDTRTAAVGRAPRGRPAR